MVNRHFHRTVDPPRTATLRDKFELVMRAAKDFPQHWASEKKKDQRPGNLECYWCFRVRSPQHFDVLQANTAYFDPQGRLVPEQEAGPQDRLVPLRRFCIGCGVKAGLHAPSDCIVTRTGLDLWVCRCRRVWQKPDCLQCPDCSSTCPLRPKRRWCGCDYSSARPQHCVLLHQGL